MPFVASVADGTDEADSEVDVDECDTRSGPRVILPTRPCRPS